MKEAREPIDGQRGSALIDTLLLVALVIATALPALTVMSKTMNNKYCFLVGGSNMAGTAYVGAASGIGCTQVGVVLFTPPGGGGPTS